MNWTKEKPTIPGYYFAKEKNLNFVVIIEYCEFDTEGVCIPIVHNKRFYEMRNECPISIGNFELFMGPIKLPEIK